MAYGLAFVFLPGIPKMLGMSLKNDLKTLPYEKQLKKISTLSLERKKADRKIKESAIFHMTAKEPSREKIKQICVVLEMQGATFHFNITRNF